MAKRVFWFTEVDCRVDDRVKEHLENDNDNDHKQRHHKWDYSPTGTTTS